MPTSPRRLLCIYVRRRSQQTVRSVGTNAAQARLVLSTVSIFDVFTNAVLIANPGRCCATAVYRQFRDHRSGQTLEWPLPRVSTFKYSEKDKNPQTLNEQNLVFKENYYFKEIYSGVVYQNFKRKQASVSTLIRHLTCLLPLIIISQSLWIITAMLTVLLLLFYFYS